MSSRFKWLKPKWLARIITCVVVAFFLYCVFWQPTFLNSTSNNWLVIVTVIYAYLTFEILVSTRQARSLPHIYVEFILLKNLEPFLSEQGAFLKRTEKFNKLQQNSVQADYQANAVFVRAQNIGAIAAVGVCLKIEYEKRNFGDVTTVSKEIPFGILKTDEVSVDLIDIFDTPTEADYFKIKEGWIEYNDINGQHSNDSPMRDPFATSAKVNIYPDVRVTLSLKS